MYLQTIILMNYLGHVLHNLVFAQKCQSAALQSQAKLFIYSTKLNVLAIS